MATGAIGASVSEQQKGKSSRRAKRRARQREEKSSGRKVAEESVEDDDEEEDGEDDEGESEEDEEPDAKPNRRERRARRARRAKEEADESEDDDEDEEEGDLDAKAIRDRNRRLRAQAAAKRRRKRAKEREAAQAVGLDATEAAEDVMARTTDKASRFVRKNFKIIQWVLIVGVVGVTAYYVYTISDAQNAAKATDQLMEGVSAERGSIGNPEDTGKPTNGVVPQWPIYEDAAARVKAQRSGFEAAMQSAGDKGGTVLAQYGVASASFDEGKYDEAKTGYEAVRSSKLAERDHDLKARSIEGIALSLEGKKDYDGALKAFEEFTQLGGRYEAEGWYHQARVYHLKKDTEKAKELLGKVQEKLKDYSKPGSYLFASVLELLSVVDPPQAAALKQKAQTEQLLEMLKSRGDLPTGDGKGDAKSAESIARSQAAIKQVLDAVNGTSSAAVPTPPAPAPSGAPAPAPSSKP